MLTKPFKVYYRRGVIPPFIHLRRFGSCDTFTYLPAQESCSFISVHALQRISKIHLHLFEVLLPGDTLLGHRTELIWYTEFYVNCGNPLYASCLVSRVGSWYKDMIVLFLKATYASLPIVTGSREDKCRKPTAIRKILDNH